MARIILLLLSVFVLHVNAQSTFTLEGNELKLPSPIVFETGSAKLKLEESQVALDYVKSYLNEKSYISLMRIEGHLANNSKSSSEQTLSEQRATAVYEWLVANGIDCKRLLAVGFGSTKPIASNETPEGKAQNNRIQFINAELRNRAIGGMPLDGGGNVAKTCR